MQSEGQVARVKSQIVEHIDRYFSGAESAADLGVWARTQSIFANPKALDNSEDWMVSNALALMSTVADATTNQPAVAQGFTRQDSF